MFQQTDEGATVRTETGFNQELETVGAAGHYNPGFSDATSPPSLAYYQTIIQGSAAHLSQSTDGFTADNPQGQHEQKLQHDFTNTLFNRPDATQLQRKKELEHNCHGNGALSDLEVRRLSESSLSTVGAVSDNRSAVPS